MSLKVSPQEINEDLCKTSIDILIEKCTEWFHQKNIDGPLWFADSTQAFPHLSESTVNIVLFGGFLKRYLESGNWSFTNARIWVLSASVQKVISRLLRIDPDHIGIIPRYELFPKSPSKLLFPEMKNVTTFVFAGRISSVKNIKMLIETVSALQTENHYPVRLALTGAYDNQTHYDQGRFELENYQYDIEQLIQSLPWKIPPVVRPKTASDKWYLEKFQNPIYVNFSTFMCEDFDVSTAQAQSLGWPCLLSDWGGHHEVTGDNVLKIPPSSIAHDHEPAPIRRIKAKALAKSLMKLMPDPSAENNTGSTVEPKSISQDELDTCRRQFILKYRDDISRAYREGLESFADTSSGRKFFASYRTLFSGPSELKSSICVLINDLHKSENPHFAEAFAVCEKLIHSLEMSPLKFISLRELFAPDSIKKISGSEIFILPFMSEEIVPILSHFITALNPNKMVIISREGLFTEDKLRKLLPLRATDLTLLYSCPDELSEVLFANA